VRRRQRHPAIPDSPVIANIIVPGSGVAVTGAAEIAHGTSPPQLSPGT
jgi:hypothetical protein